MMKSFKCVAAGCVIDVGLSFDKDGQLPIASSSLGFGQHLNREQVKQLHAHLGKLLYASEQASETPAE